MNLNELRKIAEDATQGEWKYNNAAAVWQDNTMIATCNHEEYVVADKLFSNAHHIATFSPSLILKLLNELQDAREALDSIATLIDDDSIKTTTDDDEIEYWVSDSSIQYIYDDFLAKYKDGGM